MCDFIMSEYNNLKAYKDKHKWHKFPEEKPTEFGQYLIAVNGCLHKYWYLTAQWNDEGEDKFYHYNDSAKLENYESVVAWKEIEPYDS